MFFRILLSFSKKKISYQIVQISKQQTDLVYGFGHFFSPLDILLSLGSTVICHTTGMGSLEPFCYHLTLPPQPEVDTSLRVMITLFLWGM